MSDSCTVDVTRLNNLVKNIMRAQGMSEADAAIIADSLVNAELTGVSSHGVTRVKMYTEMLQAGGTIAATKIETVEDFPAGAVLDAHDSLGVVSAYRAMNLAIGKAKECGIAIVNVRNSNHCGTAGYIASLAAGQNMIGIASTNTSKSMAPWGSKEQFIGTNPIAVVVPTDKDPIQLDMATSVVARGKIILADKKGSPIPLGWAIDEDGNPTTDAAAALKGCVLPFGGPKGSGIALLIDIICGVLSKSAYGPHINNPFSHPEQSMGCGHSCIAIDISKFRNLDEFKKEMGVYRSEVKGLALAAEVEEILLPGEVETRNREKNLREGLKIPSVVFNELKEIALGFNVEFNIES